MSFDAAANGNNARTEYAASQGAGTKKRDLNSSFQISGHPKTAENKQ
jgi:hypothetical protein